MGHCRARTLLEYTIGSSRSGVVCKKAVILQVIQALAFFMLSVKGMIFVSLLKTFSVLIFAVELLVCVQLNAGESRGLVHALPLLESSLGGAAHI